MYKIYRRTFEESAKSIGGPLRTVFKIYRMTFEDNVQVYRMTFEDNVQVYRRTFEDSVQVYDSKMMTCYIITADSVL